MAAKNSIRCRNWNSGAPHNINWLLSRDGNEVTAEKLGVNPNARRTKVYPTRSAAKWAMDNPSSICR